MIKRGYKLIEATIKLKYKIKQRLNMFMLPSGRFYNIGKIYGITDMLRIRIEILLERIIQICA